ncbi:MAG: PKD domain-containing protein, partial [Winogradskyella sp.]|nr:PKD domain-containing protein [Winogradskyella sp.]
MQLHIKASLGIAVDLVWHILLNFPAFLTQKTASIYYFKHIKTADISNFRVKVGYGLLLLLLPILATAQDVSMTNTTVNRCAPDRFFDSGGEFGNYGNNENFVTTICPQNPGEFIILEFRSFSTQLNLDIMTIYDGDDTSANIIGTFSGVASPGTILASESNTSGCLTIAFESNASGNTTGWVANIFCATPCQDINASIDSTDPAPNSTGIISILPGDSVTFNGNAIFSEDASNASYDWDFGDGNTAVGLNVINTFDSSGTYTVAFTAQDDNPQGCSDSDTITVFVLGDNLVVDDTTFTAEELIQDVLINSPCATVSNIISSTGTDFSASEPNGIGYFISNGTSFPFEDGLLLTSGRAADARGPNNINLSEGTIGVWPGDADLNAELGISSNNASFIQFDFTPLANSISFEFLMASEEYNMGTFECDFSDAFAFLLTDSNGVTTNLAVLPGTNIPILVTNIHLANTACAAVNPEYFGGYTPPNAPPMSFDGRTTVFTAQSPVTPGENYTIKLVIADDGDAAQDSGVFIKAGSFDLGGDLGDDITIDSGNASCDGNSITLDTDVQSATHTWYFNGNEIVGETGSTLDVTEPGVYSVDIVFSGVCQTSDEILVEFKTNPVLEANPVDINSCSSTGSSNFDLTQNNAVILGSQNASDFNIEYFTSQTDADADVNAITNPDNYPGADGEVIFVRLEDSATQTCFVLASFTLNVALSVASPVEDMIQCDDAINDGEGSFDIASQTPIVLGSFSDVDYMVTYHLSIEDAEAGLNPISSPFTNTINPQTIFIRVESLANGDCFETTSFDLIVESQPVIAPLTPYELCDDDTDGDQTNGITSFDLTTLNADIINGQANTVVSFFESPIDANDGTNAITNISNYKNTSANLQTIYVRLEDTLTSCFSTSNVDLVVNPLPEVTSASLFQCDEDGIPDGLTAYNLTEANATMLISGNLSDYSFSHYLTLSDATSNTNPLDSNSYSNTINPQVIFVRITNQSTGCSNYEELTLLTSATDIPNTQLETCDDDSDGFVAFNLNEASSEILPLLPPGSTISYYQSNDDALLEINPLPLNYTNSVAFLQTIFARAENANDCFGIGTIELIVNPLPLIGSLPDVVICSATPNFTEIELTQFDGAVLAGQNPAEFVVSYYESNADAQANNNPLVSPYTNITNPQEIFTRVDNTNSGCFITSSFNILVNSNPQITAPTPLEVCDDAVADGFTSIELTIKDTEISGGNPDYVVSYYETQLDADVGTNALASPYTNTSNPQTVYVRVVDTTTGCFTTTTLDLVVEQAPVAFDPSPLTYCDPDNDGFGIFTLTDADAEITGGAA